MNSVAKMSNMISFYDNFIIQLIVDFFITARNDGICVQKSVDVHVLGEVPGTSVSSRYDIVICLIVGGDEVSGRPRGRQEDRGGIR